MPVHAPLTKDMPAFENKSVAICNRLVGDLLVAWRLLSRPKITLETCSEESIRANDDLRANLLGAIASFDEVDRKYRSFMNICTSVFLNSSTEFKETIGMYSPSPKLLILVSHFLSIDIS